MTTGDYFTHAIHVVGACQTPPKFTTRSTPPPHTGGPIIGPRISMTGHLLGCLTGAIDPRWEYGRAMPWTPPYGQHGFVARSPLRPVP